jgi:hypothetical protein
MLLIKRIFFDVLYPRRVGATAATALFSSRIKGLRLRAEMPCSSTALTREKFGLMAEL